MPDSLVFEFVGGPMDGEHIQLPEDTELHRIYMYKPVPVHVTPETTVEYRTGVYRRATFAKGPQRWACLRWDGEQ